jgi:hypothetical protein
MDAKTAAALALVVGGFLVGCEKSPTDSAAQRAASTASGYEPPAPVASPKGDPSVPPADAALEKPKSAPDATPDSEVTRAERDKAMPLPGQANDHSTPEFAKRGNDSSPAKTAK